MEQKGVTVWFTGLSGAGKTALAVRLEEVLRQRGLKVERLDGDIVRQGLTRDLMVTRPDLVTLKRMQGLPVRTSKVCWRPGDFTLHYLTATDAVKADRVRKYFTTGKICWYSDTRP